jgi:rod shape determining protein RodA
MTAGYPVSVGTRRRSTAFIHGRDSWLRRIDWVLLAATTALIVLGTLLVYSATRQKMIDAGVDPQSYLKKHLLNIAIGVALGVMTSLFDYRALRAYAPIVYVGSLLGLVFVLSPLGSSVNGAQAWIHLPAGFSIQPSELAKVALVVSLAMLLAERKDAEREPGNVDIALALVVAAIPMALIMLQPDLGTTAVMAAIVLGVLAVAGVSTRWMVGLIAAGIAVTTAAVLSGFLSTYQVDRLAAFANPQLDPQGFGYNVNQSLITVGSGGLTGQGLFHGSQTNGLFVPEQQTDFVFTVAGEELGFVGSALLVVLVGLVLWRGLRIAARADDMFGRLVAVGIVCWFTFQAFENIGMTLGIMPVTGVPLPLISYGGSSMFANLMAIGLLENVHLRRSLN